MNIYEIPEFLENTKKDLIKWLDALNFRLESGRFRFSLKGNLAPVKDQKGQVSTCFATRIAWITGIWNDWPEEKRESCIQFIKSFQREDGYFIDPWLMKQAKPGWKSYIKYVVGRLPRHFFGNLKKLNLRAETRQSAATLFNLEAVPSYPLPMEAADPSIVRKYIEALDWRFPYPAGSHLAHLMCLLSINNYFFGKPDNYEELIEVILIFLDSIRDNETGTWSVGDPSELQKVNGAMKIFTGLEWIGGSYPECSSLLDFALNQPVIMDGCGFLNRLYVVHQSLRGVSRGYRSEEIKTLALQSLDMVRKFKKPDGGFSFYLGRAQTNYYGAQVSNGLSESDLHGTAMLIWAATIALELLSNDLPDSTVKWHHYKA